MWGSLKLKFFGVVLYVYFRCLYEEKNCVDWCLKLKDLVFILGIYLCEFLKRLCLDVGCKKKNSNMIVFVVFMYGC